MRIADWLSALWEDPEGRAKIFTVFWYTSLGMMVLGYLIMIYLLFLV